jgi:hypothetical protein
MSTVTDLFWKDRIINLMLISKVENIVYEHVTHTMAAQL